MNRSALTLTLALSALHLFNGCSPAGARPPCGTEPNAEQRNDVTSSFPCRKRDSRLLDFLVHVNVPDFVGFVTADHFREGKPRERPPITWIGANFRAHFLNKIEGSAPARELDVYRLKHFAHNDAIIDEIGGQPEVMLHDVWVLLARQSHGEKGPLQTDARPNVFYVRDSTGIFWAVDAVWSGAGWEVGASKPDELRLWDAQIYVIAH
jgi:hypothetical protein